MRIRKRKKYANSGLFEATCPVCGKVFYPSPEHVYHMPASKARVCSYHCMVEAERRHEANKKPRGRKRV